MKSDLKLIFIVLFTSFMAAVVFGITSGCAITPDNVDATQIAWDGNAQNAGLLDNGRLLSDGNSHISPSSRTRYNALIDLGYGRMFLPAIGRDFGVIPHGDGTFEISQQAIRYFGRMNEKHRSKQAPPN